MKIAIPTSDEINIAENLASTIGHLVFTVQFGEIVAEEFRPMCWSDLLTQGGPTFSHIKDCSVVIHPRKSGDLEGIVDAPNLNVIYTDDKIVTNIIVRYLNTVLIRESNLSCCP